MAKENEEADVEETDVDTEESSKDTNWEAKYRELGIRTRERTKALKEELIALKGDPRLKAEPEVREKKSDIELMKRLDTMALKLAGITADDEKELFEKWKVDTGREADAIVGNKIFQAELDNLRVTKANAAAADVKGGGGTESGAKSDPDYWIAKATKNSGGELVFPEDLPNDFKLRAAIMNKLADSTKSTKQFYNS